MYIKILRTTKRYRKNNSQTSRRENGKNTTKTDLNCSKGRKTGENGKMQKKEKTLGNNEFKDFSDHNTDPNCLVKSHKT